MLMMSVISEKITSKLNEGMIKDWLDSVLPSVLSFFWSVVLALLVFFIGRKIILWLIKLIEKAMRRHKLEEGVVQFTRSLLTIAMYIGLGLAILNLFGVAPTSLAAAVATLGLTAGLALQGALSNFAGGVLILLLHPFRIGDYIIEDGQIGRAHV